MSVITVSRQFGSGGRELGKRLADELGYEYFDREIVSAISEKMNLDEKYVAHHLEAGDHGIIPLSFGRTFSHPFVFMTDSVDIYKEQHKIIKELAQKGNCVIVGRAADIILKDFNPIKIFVYSDMEARIARCRKRGLEEDISDKELAKRIKKIDTARIKYHEFFSEVPWGDKEGYHLCVNTTGRDIKKIAPAVAQYVQAIK